STWRAPRAIAVPSFLAAILAFSAAGAHDFWIEPSSFRPAVGSGLRIRLRVGDGFPGEAVARNPDHLKDFFVSGPDGRTTPAVGFGRGDPAGLARVTAAGTHIIAYTSKGSHSELEAKKFESYLKEEGLEAVSALRSKKGESEKAGRETYRRSVKSLVLAGAGGPEGHDRVLGLPLELVPEKSPYHLGPERKLELKLLYNGKPLEGALVRAKRRSEEGEKAKSEDAKKTETLSGRTSAKGEVAFTLPRDGFWLITAVHMVPADDKTTADWESCWASLTFDSAEMPADPAAPRPDAR
ncbi:MAG TPA: DUF4198 domain-containing protein, partial [Planctomycetota bacterium]|nr:DUF4198 domain-containing protein [Planctomycetota bacterium]